MQKLYNSNFFRILKQEHDIMLLFLFQIILG
nr:MAG TPA: hypothetical protein [Caudoviricetes sp.]